MTYYTPMIFLVWMALFVLCVLTKENDRFSKKEKRILYLTYLTLGGAALFEWLGVQMSGNSGFSPRLLKLVKLFDYVLTPVAGGALVLQFQSKTVWKRTLFCVLGANTLFQIISFFTGWMIVVDGDNHYSHGPGYPVYMAFYLAVIILVVVEFSLYGRRFRRRNVLSLYASLTFMLTGILMQELLGGTVRTAYVSLMICAALLFIHYSEFAQLASDDQLREQMIRISEDPLTGLLSRYAYNAAVQRLAEADGLPQGLVAYSVDVNGLKRANDTMGHHAGDLLIRGAADCISAVLGSVGRCYRTGGDEFIVLGERGADDPADLCARLEQAARNRHEKDAPPLSLSAGYAEAAANPGVSVEKLIALADQEMYKAKAQYYQSHGIDQRRKTV